VLLAVGTVDAVGHIFVRTTAVLVAALVLGRVTVTGLDFDAVFACDLPVNRSAVGYFSFFLEIQDSRCSRQRKDECCQS
jgi:hypothetical protein